MDVYFEDPYLKDAPLPSSWPATEAYPPVGKTKVLEAIKPRITKEFLHGRLAVINCSREFLPFEIATHCLGSFCDHELFSCNLAPGDPIPEGLAKAEGAVVVGISGTQTELEELWSKLRPILFFRKDHNSAIVIESDTEELPSIIRTDADSIFLSSQMRLTDEELSQVFDKVTSTNVSIRLETTGGAAGLVAALSEDHFSYWTKEFDEISLDWAKRIFANYDFKEIEPFTWAPSLSNSAYEELSGLNVSDVYNFSFLIAVNRNRRSIPYALSVQLHRFIENEKPGHNPAYRKNLIEKIFQMNNTMVVDQIRMLAWLSAWEKLDSVLKYRMAWLSLLSDEQRKLFACTFPSYPPLELKSLCVANDYLRLGDSKFRYWAGGVWAKLKYLLPHSGQHPKGTLVNELVENIGLYDKPDKAITVDSTRSRIKHYVKRFSELVNDADKFEQYSENDIALLVEVINGIIDAGLISGMYREITELVRINNLLYKTYPDFISNFRNLRANMLARAALVETYNLNVPQGVEYLEEFESNWSGLSKQADEIYEIALMHIRMRKLKSRLADFQIQDLHESYSPYRATLLTLFRAAETSRSTAISYAKGILDHVSWLDIPKWQWWSLRSILILLYANEGKPNEGAELLTNAWYPEYCREILGARLRLANGEVTRALEETNKILDVPALPILWRIICYTVKISCLEILGRPASEISSTLDIVKWSDIPELVPTFPSSARRAIVDRLDPSEIIGSGSLEEVVPVKRPVLTPRQLEILRLLATGMNQPKIAEALFISRETVKSTCRGIYKRLNVSGRDQAVAEGKKLGMI